MFNALIRVSGKKINFIDLLTKKIYCINSLKNCTKKTKVTEVSKLN